MKNSYLVIYLILFLVSCNSSDLKVSSISLNKEGNIYKHKGELFNGKVIDTTETGRVLLTFECKKGKIEGDYLEYHENGNLKLKSNYHFGVKEGKSTVYYPNGNKEKIETYLKGQKTVLYETYFPNRKLKSKGNYKNWKKEGHWMFYYENGQLKEKGVFKNGKKEGVFENYYENGKLQSKGKYLNGFQNDHWDYYLENGNIIRSGKFKMGDVSIKDNLGIPLSGRNGKWRYFNEKTSKLEKVIDIKFNNDVTGVAKIFYPNGNIKLLMNVLNDKYKSIIEYDEKGKIIKEENY